MNKLNEDEVRVRKELTKVFPQLQINAKNVCGQGYSRWGDDLLQMSVEIFLEKPLKDQIDTIDKGKLEHFITYIMNFQLKRGKTTKFWHTHRKFIGSTRELFVGSYDYNDDSHFDQAFQDEVTEVQSCIDRQLKHLTPFERMLLRERIEWGSNFTDISKKYDIPYSSLQGGIKKILKKIKKQCQHLK